MPRNWASGRSSIRPPAAAWKAGDSTPGAASVPAHPPGSALCGGVPGNGVPVPADGGPTKPISARPAAPNSARPCRTRLCKDCVAASVLLRTNAHMTGTYRQGVLSSLSCFARQSPTANPQPPIPAPRPSTVWAQKSTGDPIPIPGGYLYPRLDRCHQSLRPLRRHLRPRRPCRWPRPSFRLAWPPRPRLRPLR